MLSRLRHRIPLPAGTQITLSDTTYIIQKLLDCGGSALLYEVQPVRSHRLPLVLKEQYPAQGYLRQEDGAIVPMEGTNAELLAKWYQHLPIQETRLSQLAARHNFQVIPIREQVSHAVLVLPNQPGRVISNFYALMDDRSAQGLVLSAYAALNRLIRQGEFIYLHAPGPQLAQQKRNLSYRKIPYRVVGESWWPEELPGEGDYAAARAALEQTGWQVDLVTTHCAPTPLQRQFAPEYPENQLTDFLAEIQSRLSYQQWYCGHYHRQLTLEEHRFRVLYRDIVSCP